MLLTKDRSKNHLVIPLNDKETPANARNILMTQVWTD